MKMLDQLNLKAIKNWLDQLEPFCKWKIPCCQDSILPIISRRGIHFLTKQLPEIGRTLRYITSSEAFLNCKSSKFWFFSHLGQQHRKPLSFESYQPNQTDLQTPPITMKKLLQTRCFLIVASGFPDTKFSKAKNKNQNSTLILTQNLEVIHTQRENCQKGKNYLTQLR